MNEKELYAIREWAPLTGVIDNIPTTYQRGFIPVNLSITCVDAVADFIALGSDAGITFWYNRKTGAVQKLKSEASSRITCVRIVDSVEYMVAAGNSTGHVNVFQIQKELPPDLNFVFPRSRAKSIERYTIKDMHRSPVSCCEWSKNGMKLYSGNWQGVVVLTEFDYQEHISKSVEVFRESYQIVQLSVCQSYVLVSSLYRTIVCTRNDITGQWCIVQVGKKDRKALTDCGGMLVRQPACREPKAICSRPGLRLWIADTKGNVEKTLLFRDTVERSPMWEIPMLNPKLSFREGYASSPTATTTSKHFHKLLSYPAGDNALVVSHDEHNLYILNVDCTRVEAVARGFRKILDLCICGNEIFVLEGERSLLRLAPGPEKPNRMSKIIYNPSMPPPIPLLGGQPVLGTIETPTECVPVEGEQPVVDSNAEEVFELPPIEQLELNIPIELASESPRAEQNRRLEIFKQISEMDFDDSILHHSGISTSTHGRKKRRSSEDNNKTIPKSTTQGIVEIGHVVQFDDENRVNSEPRTKPKTLEWTTKPTRLDVSFCTDSLGAIEPSSTNKNLFTQFLPESLTPSTMGRTIEEKAKTLAEELNLPPVHLEPITDEELQQCRALASAGTLPKQIVKPSLTESLTDAYPQQIQVEDAGVQTTPRKKFYLIHESGDFSDGQPVDDVCQDRLHAATMVDAMNEPQLEQQQVTNVTTKTSMVMSSAPNLRYMPTQPLCEEIDSFLMDFPHERLLKQSRRKSTPPSTESNTSSEWEFLDN